MKTINVKVLQPDEYKCKIAQLKAFKKWQIPYTITAHYKTKQRFKAVPRVANRNNRNF